MNISVLYNKPAARFALDAEHKEAEDDTEISAKEVAAALSEKDVVATLVPIIETTINDVVDGIQADLIFNLIEWTGIDAKYAVQTFDRMDARHLLYTGATKKSYMDSCDKTVMKHQLDLLGLPTATWQMFTTGDEAVDPALTYPMIVKVSMEHSSVGIEQESIVHTQEELLKVVNKRIAQYRQPVFAETFLTGREFQVTLLTKKEGIVVLPPAEIVYTQKTDVPFLTYESRWDENDKDYDNSTVSIAKFSPSLDQQLKSMSLTAFGKLGFRDYARFDIRCDKDEHPYFLELNSNPGLGDDEEYGMTLSYKAASMTFADFIWEIVQSALRRA